MGVGQYTYPDHGHNAESMLIDVSNHQLIILTKSDPQAKVYQAPLNIPDGSREMLQDTGIRLDLINATDATSSADGQVLIIRMYVGAFLWPRTSRSKGIIEK